MTETAPTPLIRELVSGQTFAGRFEVVEELGHGGMGRVYKVFDTRAKEKIALKLLKPEVAADEAAIERFENELRFARKVSHRNVCRMYDLGDEKGTRYITMEYVPGEDLKSMLRMMGPMSPGKTLHIARQICEGLAEAHRLGVVHRDLKPHNIMIDREGNVRIMDFGIARSLKVKGLTGAGIVVGTPEYMSPEQMEGKEADGRSDIYSLGIILYEMVTGRLPFEGETFVAIALKQRTETPKPPKELNPQLPDDLSRLILRCLEKDPAARYQSAEAILADLGKIDKGLPTTDKALPVKKTTRSKTITVKFNLKKAVVVPLIGVLGVLAAALVVWQFVARGAGARRSIAVITFKNQTGDKAFDFLREAIPNLLITSLEQSKRFRVTTWEGLKDSLSELGKERDAAIDEELGFELCRRKGIETIIVGTYTKAGEMFATDAKVWDVGARQILRTAAARGQGVDSILRNQIDELSRAIAKGKGLDALKIEISPSTIAEAMTTSLEAYNYYLRGRDDLERWLYSDAKRFLQRAVELDPTFAHAYLLLGEACGLLGEGNARIEAYRKAKEHAAKAPEKERLHIEAEYAAYVEKDADKRIRILEEQTRKFPDEKRVHLDLGTHYRQHGLLTEAKREYQKALALDPGYGPVLNELAYVYADSGDFEKALEYFRKYAAVSPGDPNPLDSIAEVSLRKGDLDEALRKYEEAVEVRPEFFFSLLSVAFIHALKEDYSEAWRRIEEVPVRDPTPSAKLDYHLMKAFLHYWLGNTSTALAELGAHGEVASTLGAGSYLATNAFLEGCILQQQGRFEAAEKAYKRWADYWPESGSLTRGDKAMMVVANTLVLGLLDVSRGEIRSARARFALYVPPAGRSGPGFTGEWNAQTARCLEGEIMLAERRPEEAVRSLAKTVGFNYSSSIGDVRALAYYHLPVEKDALARAYKATGETDKAIAEYKRLMTIDRTNQVRQMIPPVYHFRLAGLYEDKGLKDEARAEYRKFLEIWKDADAERPELGEARKRLAGLASR
jgi:serine/threonine protein kinase/tetratricopeptide (TPR) repeat protein